MAYDNEFAHRIREQLRDEHGVTEKAMFGGLAFLLDGNMAVGISNGGKLIDSRDWQSPADNPRPTLSAGFRARESHPHP